MGGLVQGAALVLFLTELRGIEEPRRGTACQAPHKGDSAGFSA